LGKIQFHLPGVIEMGEDIMKEKRKIDSVAQASTDLLHDQTAQLRALFPECVSEGKIDFDKLRANLALQCRLKII
jgi:hypothetical protein